MKRLLAKIVRGAATVLACATDRQLVLEEKLFLWARRLEGR